MIQGNVVAKVLSNALHRGWFKSKNWLSWNSIITRRESRRLIINNVHTALHRTAHPFSLELCAYVATWLWLKCSHQSVPNCCAAIFSSLRWFSFIFQFTANSFSVSKFTWTYVHIHTFSLATLLYGLAIVPYCSAAQCSSVHNYSLLSFIKPIFMISMCPIQCAHHSMCYIHLSMASTNGFIVVFVVCLKSIKRAALVVLRNAPMAIFVRDTSIKYGKPEKRTKHAQKPNVFSLSISPSVCFLTSKELFHI